MRSSNSRHPAGHLSECSLCTLSDSYNIQHVACTTYQLVCVLVGDAMHLKLPSRFDSLNIRSFGGAPALTVMTEMLNQLSEQD
jgi:hypothetical protein